MIVTFSAFNEVIAVACNYSIVTFSAVYNVVAVSAADMVSAVSAENIQIEGDSWFFYVFDPLVAVEIGLGDILIVLHMISIVNFNGIVAFAAVDEQIFGFFGTVCMRRAINVYR